MKAESVSSIYNYFATDLYTQTVSTVFHNEKAQKLFCVTTVQFQRKLVRKQEAGV